LSDRFNLPSTVIVANGELPATSILAAVISDKSRVIACDGAANALASRGIRCQVIIGDLDSLGAGRAMFEAHGTSIVHEPDQDSNDLEKALTWIWNGGATDACIVGAGGGMYDHALSNFSVIARWAPRLRLAIVEERGLGFIVPDRAHMLTESGDRVSLVPLPTATITTHGLRWELSNEELSMGIREGASNQAISDFVYVVVHSGVVAIFHTSPRYLLHRDD
jgi:thiamine pyrophosphokinase